jgi:hypothetical protein
MNLEQSQFPMVGELESRGAVDCLAFLVMPSALSSVEVFFILLANIYTDLFINLNYFNIGYIFSPIFVDPVLEACSTVKP